MNLSCPQCNSTIGASDVNITADIAKCSECNALFKASDLINQNTKRISMTTPRGSKLELNTKLLNGVELFYPKTGFTAANIFVLLFSVLWLGFDIVLTFLALNGPFYFAFFSIPFWIIGIGILASAINSSRESQTIEISSESIQILKARPFRPKNYSFSFEEVDSITLETRATKDNANDLKQLTKSESYLLSKGMKNPTLKSGIQTVQFLESADFIEKQWITDLLSSILSKQK